MKRKKTEPQELLTLIAEEVDDGFLAASVLPLRFSKLGHRDLVRLRKQAVREGSIVERRGTDGQLYLALTAEGWRVLGL